MKIRKFSFKLSITILILAVLLFLACYLRWDGFRFGDTPEEKNPVMETDDRGADISRVKYYDEKLFQSALEKTRNNQTDFPDCDVAGGIIPHHLLISHFITDFFQNLSDQPIENIIIVGPNHFEKGARIITSGNAWETPFGSVAPNSAVISKLEKINGVRGDDEVMEEEFSVSSIIPFVRYYFPNAKITPVILRRQIDESLMNDTVDILASELKNEGTVMIAAVDFSHYLEYKKAEEKDKETEKYIQNFDYDSIKNLSNDYVDSPSSVIMELMALEKVGVNDIHLVDHLNSSLLEGQSQSNTTSYFSFVFCR